MPHTRVSIVMPTYDRAATLPRAIDSVLRQDDPAWELIVVDDGSRDETTDILQRYRDPRVRVVRHEANRGVTAAKNTGLDHVSGEWFTVLDSDDELIPDGLSTLLAAVDTHPDVDAVSCNCRDSVTGRLTGSGLDHDGYMSLRTLVGLAGEHWGITKTSLLGTKRFDERLHGLEGVLWLKISANATCYYVHRALRIYHSEGQDRVSLQNESLERQLRLYEPLADDEEYLALLRRVDPGRYANVVFQIALACAVAGRRKESWGFFRRYEGPWRKRAFLLTSCVMGQRWVRGFYALKDSAARRAT